MASIEDKPPVESKPPLVADKPHTRSPIAQARKHIVAGVPLIPVTHQMEEILNRQRLATESAIRKDIDDSGQPRCMSVAKSPKFPPPVVKKKPVRAPVKSSDFLDEKKSHEFSGVVSRSCENLVTAANEEGVFVDQGTNSDKKLDKRISASYSVEDIKELKEPAKPPTVKARKMLPGAVRLITPKPKEGQVELTKSPEDESDSTPNQDKEDTSLDRSRPETPEITSNSPDNKDDNSPNDEQAEAVTGGSEILLLPDWTTEEVCVWLQRCGLGELTTSLRLGDVTGKMLLDLDGGRMKVSII